MNESRTELPDCIVKETGSAPDCSVIWLHGLGADGNDFAPIVPQLRCARSRPIRFVFPHAPVRSVTVNGGMRMRAWYDILGFEIARDQDLAGIGQSLRLVDALIERELDRGIDANRLVLAGFSQGGAIALRAGLARSQPLAGVMGLSCYLLEGANLDHWLSGAGRSTSVLMAHGRLDPVVPIALGRGAAEALGQAGVEVEWHEYAMQHAVCPEELGALDDWLDRRLAR